ncbi:hypothetical protein MUG84_07635 [Paenibacillus sp. KQZ6P-2]|uniref:Uncharacterized protein n=1 Tax=Paenibacillus mangrovi TaxID=2931978 RepID=A0A9X1WN91_9BACL|nr:hypothetical protein [Paenibacillus mangrovi]MCJ8011621.1 hypothetical protein [Paenibacillus mangrovi]
MVQPPVFCVDRKKSCGALETLRDQTMLPSLLSPDFHELIFIGENPETKATAGACTHSSALSAGFLLIHQFKQKGLSPLCSKMVHYI